MPWVLQVPLLEYKYLVCFKQYYTVFIPKVSSLFPFLYIKILHFFLYSIDKPGPPGGPIHFKTVTAEKITLLWDPPADDGGASVTHYIVEKRETSRVVWSVVSEKQEECSATTTKVIKGNEYIFRVRGVNKFGVGEPLESESVIAKNAFGKLSSCS